MMCNLSEAVFEKGMNKEIKKGINKGILQERLDNLIRYMNKTHCSLKEAMEFNDLPLSEYDYYKELLEKKMNSCEKELKLF